MKNKESMSDIQRTLESQNEQWARVIEALKEVDGEMGLLIDPGILEEIDGACRGAGDETALTWRAAGIRA